MPDRSSPRWLASCAIAVSIASTTNADDGRDLFRTQVRSILTDRCMSCHDATTRKGGLDLSRRATALTGGKTGAAIAPKEPEASLLLDRIDAGEMPPKSPLAPEQIASLRAWIAAGAPYEDEPLLAKRAGPDWWSLRPIARPGVPTVPPTARVRNPIDAFVLARLERAHLSAAPEADRATLIRRLSLDLVGLPPSPEEVDGFVNDARADAYERLVDRLLASPRYGERWARLWLDAVRFGESNGYETNTLRKTAWPYRDWTIRAFNDDLPFARFVAEQFAGDTLPDGDWLTKAATGFLVGGVHDVVGNQTVEGMRQQRVDDLDDMITATGSAFLGLTVHCARCHDHKFDPIKQEDYYGLQAMFTGVDHAERAIPAPDAERRLRERPALEAELATMDAKIDATEPLAEVGAKATRRVPVDPGRNVERFAPVLARFVRFTVASTVDGSEPCLDELEVFTAGDAPKDVALASTGSRAKASSLYPDNASHAIEHVNDGRFGNARSWISREPGKGWIELELPTAQTIDRVVWGRDREGKYRDRLAANYTIEVATEPGSWHLVASSEDRAAPGVKPVTTDPERAKLLARREELRAKLVTMSGTMNVYAGTFRTPGPTHLLNRGDPMQPGPEVVPSGIRTLTPPLVLARDASESDRRQALARWIADPANPLPPRVMVNRLWHGHFGRGIVATPGDFGFNGDRPSHPELLDWLARSFLENGGRLKPIHRLIVTSATYRQSSRLDDKAMAVDRDNRLLWRMSPRRLEAEAIRDAMLSSSGKLDLHMGGPGYSLWEENGNYVYVYIPRVDLGPDANRRMIYQFKPRSQPDPTFGAFDCPDAALVAPRRTSSTTALQALNLLNSRFVLAQSAAMADRLKYEAGDEAAAQVRRGFLLILGREPSEGETTAAVALVREHGAAAMARALYNANEFVYVR
ncbi:MAG: hypothetical protein JWN86_2968 [Planctomycetota bacterium]|nr:hypothetical protein [Planctomycetota bacterium]